MTNNLQKAQAAWPELPDWVRVLANECDTSNQSRVAAQIGYSGGAVSQVLANKYTGRLDSVEAAVRGAYLGGTVTCPVLGTLSVNRCLTHQRAKFAPTNRQRVQLFKACRTCPNRRT